MDQEKPKPIKHAQLDEYVELVNERKALDQKSRALARRIKSLGETFTANLKFKGANSMIRHGYRIALVEGRPRVSWKDEFIGVASAEEADRILSEAPRSESLQVAPR